MIIPPVIFNGLVNLIITVTQAHLGENYLQQSFHNWIILYIVWILFDWPWLETLAKSIRKDYQTVIKLKAVNQTKKKVTKNHDK